MKILAFSVVLFSFLASTSAEAAGVVVCNYCFSPKDAAINSGTGYTLVLDYDSQKLYAYEVEYDRELKRYRAVTNQVPESINQSFLRGMSISGPSAITERNMKSRDFMVATDSGSVNIILRPGDPNYSNPIQFPDAFRNSNAYEVVNSASVRGLLGQALARELAGATTGNPTWDSLAFQLQSIILSIGGSTIGVGSYRFLIIWQNGTRTVYTIDPSTITEARYVNGESRDDVGNLLPDANIANPDTAGGYAGEYRFSSGGSFGSWQGSAGIYGVPVSNGSSSSTGMACGWDGANLTCKAK
ncbi:hypothetical protein [Xanthomonas hortorum]|uniref:Secreted protein n=1 Tax=Xanthomonas hortorum pv. gardneri TaxID=2754056 RepID=A0A6V7C0C9_9XANT|nr:hypothetical protein [Xanthomonas hortorum]APP81853.1 hypothetical protein BJD10_21125 [Xanthomonas hortorum pv. gardneri]MCC8499275.1 hypothetical protein [Xanthomonas hortorum pv. gardneri]MCC8507860.1 hypothetical protein [Xanthomonas hortorum pv. gardneri]MCC8512377.1 hypothetical protein [Xanthomonas hortorum pv. gardneri]MCC8520802.1 hypothetical protein [Xanthomonas hortorum pv. gardneri]